MPTGETCSSWIALHVIDFLEVIQTLWAVASEDKKYILSGQGFPPGFNFTLSGKDINVSSSVSAPVYIEEVLYWIEAEIMNDDSNFFSDDDNDQYDATSSSALYNKIYVYLFHVYAILFSTYQETFQDYGMIVHLNSTFKHFIFFCTQFELLPEQEVECLMEYVRPIRKSYLAAMTPQKEDLKSSRFSLVGLLVPSSIELESKDKTTSLPAASA